MNNENGVPESPLSYFLRHPLLAGLFEGLALAVVVLWIGTHLQSRNAAQDRKVALLGKVIHEGNSAVSILATFTKSELWLARYRDPKDTDDLGRSRDQVIGFRDNIYQLYVQQPKIEAILEEIQTSFSQTKELTEKLAAVRAALKKLEALRVLAAKENKIEMDLDQIEAVLKKKEIDGIIRDNWYPAFKDLLHALERDAGF